MAGIDAMEVNTPVVVRGNDPEEGSIINPVENPRVYRTARMQVGPRGYHPYHPVLNYEDISEDDEIDENLNEEDILESAGEVSESEVEELIAEVDEEDDIEEQFLLNAVEYFANEATDAQEETANMKAKLLVEVEKNHRLEVSLAIKEAEKLQLQEKLDNERKDRCMSYWALHKEVEEFPVAKKELGYEINRSVVVSMLRGAFEEARNNYNN